MNKPLRFAIYISILLIYNLTTLYSASVHNHRFSWEDSESCNAYIISISQHSDTYPFAINLITQIPQIDLLNLKSYQDDLSIDIIFNFSNRAPPALD